MSKKSELVKNTLVLGFGKLVAQMSTFLLLPVYTIFLSPGEFGAVDLIISYVALLAPLLMLQLDRAAFRFLIEARGDASKSRAVVSNTVYIVAPILIGAGLLYTIVAVTVNIPYAPLLAASVISMVFSMLSLQFARGFARNDLYAIGSVVLGLMNLAVSGVLVAGFKMGAEGVLWGLAISNFAAAIYISIALRLNRYISLDGSASDIAMRDELISFAWPLVPSAVSWWFIRTFDRTLVTIIVGVTANGIYAAANKYAAIYTALYTIFDLSWTESASAHINSKDRDKFFSSVYNNSFKFFAALAIGFIAMIPFVFGLIVGDEFIDAKNYIPVLVIGGFLNALVAQYSVIYIAKKLTRQVLVTSISVAVISVLLNIILVNLIGVMGAAVALAVSFAVMAIWRHYDVKKYVNIKFEKFIFFKIGGAILLTTTMYYAKLPYMDIINLIVSVAIALALSKTFLSSGYGKLRNRFAKKHI